MTSGRSLFYFALGGLASACHNNTEGLLFIGGLIMNCLHCGKSLSSARWRVRDGSAKYCDLSCYGKTLSGNKNPHWRGGKTISSQGYVVLSATKERELEHRSVMEKVLGRSLKKWEQVHHINQVKTDNRPENLCVMSIEEHGRLHGKDKDSIRSEHNGRNGAGIVPLIGDLP